MVFKKRGESWVLQRRAIWKFMEDLLVHIRIPEIYAFPDSPSLYECGKRLYDTKSCEISTLVSGVIFLWPLRFSYDSDTNQCSYLEAIISESWISNT